MNVVVRAEEPRDADAIRRVTEAAFGSPVEAILIDRLRRDGDLVVSLVAAEGDEIVGHIAFSRLFLEAEGGRHAALALAPLSVRPDHQRQGIGGRLVRAGHEAAARAGESLIVVLGDPLYYGCFGYSHARARDFESRYQMAELQALALGPAPRTGRLVYPRAFDGL